MDFCFKQFRVAFQSEPFFGVSKETQELKLSFLSCFRIRLSEDVRLSNIRLSEGSLVRCQKALARGFFAVSSRTWMKIGKEFWLLGEILIVESQAADSIVSVKLWTESYISFGHLSRVLSFTFCSTISRNFSQSMEPFVKLA